MKFRVKLTQRFAVTRTTEIEVDAESHAAVLFLVESGEIPIPAVDDPCWIENWEMTREDQEVPLP
jgi:hypothetical protein